MNIPHRSTKLLGLIEALKHNPPSEENPLVVHCRAGIGRTGTFLLILSCIEEVQRMNTVDVIHSLHQLRHQRMNSVETEAQFKFASKCILDFFNPSASIQAHLRNVQESLAEINHNDLFQPIPSNLELNKAYELINLHLMKAFLLQKYVTGRLENQ